MQKQKRIRNKKHLKLIASLPCCVSGVSNQTQACHIRHRCYSMGMKPGDNKTIPLWWGEHLRQHEVGEKIFWSEYGGIEKALELAEELYKVSGDDDKGNILIWEFVHE